MVGFLIYMKYIKFIAIAVLFAPFLVSAQTISFDTNLSYGSSGAEVYQLQEFLTAQGVYKGPITGNFYSLTLSGVKAFQKAESITPVSGYFGPISRETANSILASETTQSEGSAATTTMPVDLSKTTPVEIHIPIPMPPPQTVIPTPITQPNVSQPVFSNISPTPTCQLTGTTTITSYAFGLPRTYNATIDWNTQDANNGSFTQKDNPTMVSNTATWQMSPILSGETKDIAVGSYGSTFTASINGESGSGNCTLTLP